MNLDAAALLEQAGRCARLLERESDGDRFDGVSSDGQIRVASDQELLRALAESTRLARLVEADRVRLAGEIARRSETGDEASLAKKSGTTGPVDLVAQVTGMRRQEAGVLVSLGRAVRRNETFTGDVLPPDRPHVAAALAAGRLDKTVAAALLRAVKKSEPGLTPGEALELERQLVERAQDGTTADDLIGFFKRVPDFAHPEGAKSRENDVAKLASVTVVLKGGSSSSARSAGPCWAAPRFVL